MKRPRNADDRIMSWDAKTVPANSVIGAIVIGVVSALAVAVLMFHQPIIALYQDFQIGRKFTEVYRNTETSCKLDYNLAVHDPTSKLPPGKGLVAYLNRPPGAQAEVHTLIQLDVASPTQLYRGVYGCKSRQDADLLYSVLDRRLTEMSLR